MPQRRLWLLLPLVMALLASWRVLSSHLSVGNSISVMVEEIGRDDARDSVRAADAINQIKTLFERYNPGSELRWQLVPSAQLHERLRFQHLRGLGPDLVLVLDTDLLQLQQQGWIRPVRLRSWERNQIRPVLQQALESNGEALGVPQFLFTRVACFDRSVLPQPPQDLDGLIELGKQGTPVGLHSSLSELWWLFSSFTPAQANADDHALTPPALSSVLAFLRWLRLANLQPAIVFEADAEQLRRGLLSGRYSWVICPNRWLTSLQASLGSKFGQAMLPGGPQGPPRPLVHMRVWAFGSQSSPRQHALARALVQFSTNLVQQRSLAMQLGAVLPVNPGVALPLKVYPSLALQDQQFRRGTVLSLQQFARLEQINGPAQPLLDAVLSGSQSPETIAPRLQAVIQRGLGL